MNRTGSVPCTGIPCCGTVTVWGMTGRTGYNNHFLIPVKWVTHVEHHYSVDLEESAGESSCHTAAFLFNAHSTWSLESSPESKVHNPYSSPGYITSPSRNEEVPGSLLLLQEVCIWCKKVQTRWLQHLLATAFIKRGIRSSPAPSWSSSRRWTL